jgi:transcription initiation factor TFIID subunit TAF12
MKKPHASTESGKPTKRESADEHQVTRENMGARREQRKRHHRSRKPCWKAIYFYFYFYS